MCGTAVEVTPIRSIDDQEIGPPGPDHARDPAGVPGHGSRPQAAVGRLARLPDANARAGVTTRQSRTTVPLSGAYLGEREEELVLEVLRSGRLSLGPMIDRFEQMIAERVGAPYAVALSSGTAGLHLLCRIAGIQPGDEVITSPISFVASANCFILEGGTPVFADVDPRTLNMDPRAVEAAITERTKAIVAVDMFGYPCELDELRTIADRHGLLLIEDAAEALGRNVQGAPDRVARPVGCLRLLPEQADHDRRGRRRGHTLGGGAAAARQPPQPGSCPTKEGAGSITCRSASTTDGPTSRQRSASRNWRSSTRSWRCDVRPPSATRSCSQTLPAMPLAEDDGDHVRSWFVYVVQLEPGVDRDNVMESLRGDGIATAEYVPCVHLQPYMRELYGFSEGDCPVAEDTSRRTLALPFHTGIDRADQQRVVDALRRAL